MSKPLFCSLLITLGLSPAFAQGAAAPAGNGLYAVPSSAAYADLTNAANHMLDDVSQNFPSADTVVIYDQQTFASVIYYQSAVDLVKRVMQGICQAEKPPEGSVGRLALTPSLDFGGAASGLAALIGVTLPAYAIQGQAVPLDNTALIGAFAAAAKNKNYTVVIPAYLLPAAPSAKEPLGCKASETSNSLADLWTTLNAEAYKASKLPDAGKSPLKDALDQYNKLRDIYLAADKGPPLLGKLLVIETLGRLFADAKKLPNVVVVDMKLDAAGMDSTTKTILWWRTTKFSSNVEAHYSLFRVDGSGTELSLALVKPGYVNVLTKDLNQAHFANSVKPAGVINPCPPRQTRDEKKKACVPSHQSPM